MFKKMLASMGAGGGSVETTLRTPSVYPGGTVEGTIDVRGGKVEQDIEYVAVSLVARVEVETDDSEYDSNVSFHEHRLTGAFRLEPEAQHQFPFAMQVPWECPFNVLGGQKLPKCFVGVRTELEIARAIDKTDIDELAVYALPGHERVLAALTQLGFRFTGADMEKGRVSGATLPFYQEIEFAPSPEFARAFNQLEVTFVTGAHEMDVILEADKRGGFLSAGADQITKFTVALAEAESYDWHGALRQQLASLAQRRGLLH